MLRICCYNNSSKQILVMGTLFQVPDDPDKRSLLCRSGRSFSSLATLLRESQSHACKVCTQVPVLLLGFGGKEFGLVKQLRAETKRAVTWPYDSCVPYCLKTERMGGSIKQEHQGSGVS